jgi:hypothetical protein
VFLTPDPPGVLTTGGPGKQACNRQVLPFMRTFIIVMVIGVVGVHVADSASSPQQEKPGIAALEWMAGFWVGVEHGIRMEEFWMRSAGGVMLGLHRDIDSAGLVWFEYLRIEATQSGIVYVASPQGRGPTVFPLKETSRGRAVFENLEQDFPQRIIYRLEDDGLHARIEGLEDGKVKAREWVWKKSQ